MTTAEAIDRELVRLHHLHSKSEWWSDNEFTEIIRPFHDALFELAKRSETAPKEFQNSEKNST